MDDVLMVVADEATANLYAVDRGSGRTTLGETVENHADARYAAEIARRIEEAHAAGRAREVALVMPFEILELVRGRLNASARNAIFSEVPHRRVSEQPGEVLREVMDARSRDVETRSSL
jgi:hypothetical protein